MDDFVSVILPCRNEEKTIGVCIKKIQKVFSEHKIKGEIIVSDSSLDDSAKIAKTMEVKVVKHDKEGYGYAYHAGFKHAKGNIIIIGDADNTYDFSEIPKLLSKAKNNDIVIGSRLKGKIHKGAMPWLHRYIGNPLISFFLRALFGSKISDTQSGFRLIKKDAWEKLSLNTLGMEFASEMIIRATKQNLKVAEVPISYYPRPTGSESKLKSLRDGWKHIRFMLLYSHSFLFLFPGILLLLAGIFMMTFSPAITRFALLSVLLIVIGYEIILLGVFAKIYATVHLKQPSKLVDTINRYISLEKGMIIGLFIFIIGIVLILTLNDILPALTLFMMGIQTLFASFFMSIIGIEQ